MDFTDVDVGGGVVQNQNAKKKNPGTMSARLGLLALAALSCTTEASLQKSCTSMGIPEALHRIH